MILIQRAKLRILSSYIGRPLLLLVLFDIAIAAAYVFGGCKWLALPDVPLSVFGGIIGVIAGFRNATAYARWWEARTIWGAVVNNSRSFAREVLTMIDSSEGTTALQCRISASKRKLILLQIAYVHSLRNHLRGVSVWSELSGLVCEREMEFLRAQQNVPLAIQQSIASILAECYRQGWINDIQWVHFDRTLSLLMDNQGASERIKNTPMPRLYDLFIRLFINIFCILLPLGMVASLGLWTPLGSALVGFMFLALDKIGRDLEMPFANSPHDISLTSITRGIEINLKQMIGEKEVPEPIASVDGVLW